MEPKMCTISQGFSQNFSPNGSNIYDAGGHTGVDEVCGWGTDVYALKQGFVYKILDDKHPANDGSGYWGVFIITTDGDLCEWQCGHLSEIYVKPGDKVEPWTIIGKEGNKGTVFTQGIMITKAMQDAGDRRGSHRHWNKKPLIRRTKLEFNKSSGHFLSAYGSNWPLFQDENGWCYEIKYYNNGMKGSVDPMHDLEDGYERIRRQDELSDAEEKVVTDGLKVARQAIKYPFLRGFVLKLLQTLSDFLGKRK